MKHVLFLFSLILLPTLSRAASCCGGGFSIPALILGDDRAQFTTALSTAEVSDEVLANGKWLKRKDRNRAETLKLEGAYLFSDTLQGGITLPVVLKTADNHPTQGGLGDVSIYLGHETFPEGTYSKYRPKGVTFLQLTLPTAPSIYDESSSNSTEIRGRGFYALGAGLALIKTYTRWDFNLSAEIHRAFARTNNNSEIRPGWGTSQSLGVGWNSGDLRIGSYLSFLFEQAIEVRGEVNSSGHEQKNFTLGFMGSYMLTPESALTLNYADQTLIGNPMLTSLTKTLTLSFQQRWPL